MQGLSKSFFVGSNLNSLSLKYYFIGLLFALGCGIIAAVASSVRSRTSKSFAMSLVLLPMVVQTIIMMVNGSVGVGIAMTGAFSLVRFRSVPGKAKDIAGIFLAMTAGLVCGAGYGLLAMVFTAVIGGIMMLLTFVPMRDQAMVELHITVPESLRFVNGFDDLFDKYTRKHWLVRAKTTNMGSLYKLFYKIEMKDSAKMQEFIDDLRCRNGNLEIVVSEILEGGNEL